MRMMSAFVSVARSAAVTRGFGNAPPVVLLSALGTLRRSQVIAKGLDSIHQRLIWLRACSSVSPVILPPLLWWSAVLLLGPPRPCRPMHIMSRSLKRLTPAYIQRWRVASTPPSTPGRDLLPIQLSRASAVERQLLPPASAPHVQGLFCP